MNVTERADPPTVVSVIFPVFAPAGTVALTLLSEFTVNDAFTLPNDTFVVCVRPLPLIVTTVPTGPLVGAMLLIVGVTLNCWLMAIQAAARTDYRYRTRLCADGDLGG